MSKSPPRAVDTSCLNDLLEQLNEHAVELKARELSNVLLACRRLKVTDHRTWTTMCNQARKCVTDFNSQETANTTNALAHSRYSDAMFVQALAGETVRKASDFNSQEHAERDGQVRCVRRGCSGASVQGGGAQGVGLQLPVDCEDAGRAGQVRCVRRGCGGASVQGDGAQVSRID